MLYIIDSGKMTAGTIELNTDDMLAMQRFNNEYGFLHKDSLWDIPAERGVRQFYYDREVVFVAECPITLAAETELWSRVKIRESQIEQIEQQPQAPVLKLVK